MTTSILTIDPGTRYWGVSVFHGRDIFTCMVKNLSAKDSPRNRLREARKIFLGLCRDHVPDILIIEKLHFSRESQSEYLGRIIRELKRLSKKKHLRVTEYSPETVRRVVCKDVNATKEHISEAICQFYPELKMCLNQNHKCNHGYWGCMSKSIGLGICYFKSRDPIHE